MADRRGPHRVAPVMGTVISIDVRDPGIPESVVDAMLARLEEIESRFSTYRPSSEISRIVCGELAEADASAEVRFVLGMCDDLQRTTGGWFDARGHRADGCLDRPGWSRAGRWKRRPSSLTRRVRATTAATAAAT